MTGRLFRQDKYSPREALIAAADRVPETAKTVSFQYDHHSQHWSIEWYNAETGSGGTWYSDHWHGTDYGLIPEPRSWDAS